MDMERSALGLLGAGLLVVVVALPQAGMAGAADAADPMMTIAPADFEKVVMSSNAFEIRSSELARDKATSQDVKDFAAQMITDHAAADEKLKAAMGQAAAPPADPLSPKHAAMIALLQAADAAAFEPLYIDMQAGAHREAVSLFRTFSKSGPDSGDDAAVVSFAKATLPTLERHETHIMEIVVAH